ncbi:hypothetical protein VTN02DRAFT_83 [Thermoascus thermophilus]
MSGIARTSAECVRNLSDIAPAVFSPGYRDAVSQRACFVPVIAKTLTSMLNKTSSQSLQRRLSALQGLAISQYGDNLTCGASNTPDTRSMIKCLLWRILQKGVYRPQAARKLSPLDFTLGTTEGDSPMLNEDPSIAHSWGSIDVPDLEEGDYNDDDDDDSALTFPEDEYCAHDPGNDMDMDDTDNFSDMLENSNSNDNNDYSTESLDAAGIHSLPDSSLLDEHEQSENLMTDIPRSSPPLLSTAAATAAFSSSPLTLNDDDLILCPSAEEPDIGLLFSDLPELETSSARPVVAPLHDVYMGNTTESGDGDGDGDGDDEMLYD